jgi:type II secretory pathway pseudopilin PulG
VELLIVLALLVILGLAAARVGVDSREGFDDDHQRPLIDAGHRA